MRSVPVFRPSLLTDSIDNLRDTLQSGWWGTGPKVDRFEEAFADYIDVSADRCVMLNSCTAALHLAVQLYSDAQRFLVPALTFISTGLAPRYQGKTVVFVEVGDDLCIDQDDALNKLGSPDDVVIAVHLGGQAAAVDKLRGQCHVIEDCAHALGTYDAGQHVGTQHVGCFSFQSTKGLPIGDGGMLVLGDADQREATLATAWCGIGKSTWDRSGEGYQWQYNVEGIGYKYRANDIMAALALDQLLGFSRAIGQRAHTVRWYNEVFADLDWLRTPTARRGTWPCWQEYIIRTPYRDALAAHLQERGVASTVHYYPIHNYQPLWWLDDGILTQQKLPRTEQLWKEILTIPCFAGMTTEEKERVIDGVRTFRP